MSHAHLGDDVERPATGQRHGQLGERLQAATEPRGRAADALGDRLELAAGRRDQGQDAIRLTQVEARQHDGVGRVTARDGHPGDGTTTAIAAAGRGRGPRIQRMGGRRVARLHRAGVCRVLARRMVPPPADPDPAKVPATGGTRFVYTRRHDHCRRQEIDLANPPRRHRKGRSCGLVARSGSPSSHGLYVMVRFHLGLDASGASGGQTDLVRRSACSPTPSSPATILAPSSPRRGRGTGTQLQPRPRRHRGWRHGAAPPPNALDGRRHPAGHQRGRHALQPLADRAPDRLQGADLSGFSDACPPADASVRPHLPLPSAKASTSDNAQSASLFFNRNVRLSGHDRAQDGVTDRIDRSGRAARDRRSGIWSSVSRGSAGRSARVPAQGRPAQNWGSERAIGKETVGTSPTRRRRCRSSMRTKTAVAPEDRARPGGAVRGRRDAAMAGRRRGHHDLERTGAREYPRPGTSLPR